MNTFIPAAPHNSSVLHGSTLILPVVSIGNVPQLTIDLLISTLAFRRIGFLDDENVLPVAGAREDGGVGVTVAMEVFLSEDRKWTIIQQRSPVAAKKSRAFTENLLAFIQASKFLQVVLLTSADASRRIDVQLEDQPFRILTTPELPSSLSSRLSELGLRTLERVPGEDVILPEKGLDGDDSSIPAVTGGGLARYLFLKMKETGIGAVMVIRFAMEGDNVPDAIAFANCINAILELIQPGQGGFNTGWKPPTSWEGLFGTPFEHHLY